MLLNFKVTQLALEIVFGMWKFYDILRSFTPKVICTHSWCLFTPCMIWMINAFGVGKHLHTFSFVISHRFVGNIHSFFGIKNKPCNQVKVRTREDLEMAWYEGTWRGTKRRQTQGKERKGWENRVGFLYTCS